MFIWNLKKFTHQTDVEPSVQYLSHVFVVQYMGYVNRPNRCFSFCRFFFFWWDLIVLCLSAGVALFMAGPSGPVILWSWTHCICKRSPHRHSWFGREVCVLCSWSECLCPLTFILFCILWHIHVQNLLCCGGHNLHVNLLENECRALQ